MTVTADSREARFEALFDEHALAVHRYVARRSHTSDVDDIVADVFLVAWQKIDAIPDDFQQPWLFRTAWNVLANRRRKFVELPFEQLPDDPRDGDIAEVVVEDVTLRAAWLSLGARDREVLRLVAWDGLNGAELAAALGISVSGAGVALSRARARFEAACTETSSETTTFRGRGDR